MIAKEYELLATKLDVSCPKSSSSSPLHMRKNGDILAKDAYASW